MSPRLDADIRIGRPVTACGRTETSRAEPTQHLGRAPTTVSDRPVAVIGACRKLSLNVELRGLAGLFARDPYRPQGLLYGCFCSTRRAPLSKRLMVTFLLGKLGASSPATSKASMAIRASLLF